jgi:hypothetical protein
MLCRSLWSEFLPGSASFFQITFAGRHNGAAEKQGEAYNVMVIEKTFW